MAPLERIAAHLRAVLAAHATLEFMDGRRLRSAHDVEGNLTLDASPFRVPSASFGHASDTTRFDVEIGILLPLIRHPFLELRKRNISAAGFTETG
jgi:hypothetical protein